jgi:hypothetical protein
VENFVDNPARHWLSTPVDAARASAALKAGRKNSNEINDLFSNVAAAGSATGSGPQTRVAVELSAGLTSLASDG